MRFRYSISTWVLLIALFAAVAPASTAQNTASPTAQHRATSTPYTGDLSIFDTPGREQKLHINQVMEILAIATGKNVADIGAGSGWFTMQAAKRVSNSGTVYAADINPEALRHISQRAKKERLQNVRMVMGKADTPQLPPDCVDSVLLLKTYHEVAEPVAWLRNLRSSLRPGARLGIIDRDGNGADHGVQKEVVLREAREAGYRLLEEHDDLVKDDKMDYFLVFGVM